MRICQVVHGFPPVERTGVENYTEGLCRALARAGHRVEVFVPRRDPQLADLALRREERGGYAVNWIARNHPPASQREALLVPELRKAFAAFLDRERPEVVHFQHLIKLGLGLVEAAGERGIPTVYTAHDYYPICHRYTLLRPDLTMCDARGDSAACARCDLALSVLNEQPGLGDYQTGVLAEQLSPEARATLADVLAGRPSERGPSPEAVQAALEQRAELDRARAQAYQSLDLVLAPSQALIAELERGGFPAQRIQLARLGFDNSDLAAVPPPRTEPGRAVRFAFVGALGKHKGVHVLLEAFARLRGRAELAIHGGSSDTAYVEMLRRRCTEVGAQWRGPFERSELPSILPAVDALVVPSVWLENYPLVIHEAFSARRPVLASRIGGIPESVRDGVDGLLFAPGDVDDLARTLQRCIDEPGLLASLARNVRPVRGMDDEARELAERYGRLSAAKSAERATAELPSSLARASLDLERVSALPSRELFVRVLAGLDGLREAWSDALGGQSAVELLAQGLGEGSEAQDRLREARNEIAWLRTKKEELDEGREELMEVFEDLDKLLNETRTGSQRQAAEFATSADYVRTKEAEVAAAHERLSMLEDVISAKNRYIGEVEGHVHEAARYIEHKDEDYVRLESELGRARERVRVKEDELRVALERARQREDELHLAGERSREQEAELRRASERSREQEAELRRESERSRELDEELRRGLERERAREEDLRVSAEVQRVLERAARSSSQVGMLAVQAQERVLNRALRPILLRLHALLDPRGKLEVPADGASFAELLQNVNRVRDGLDVVGNELEWLRPMSAELEWRRERMRKLVRVFEENRLLRFLLRGTALGRKLDRWSGNHDTKGQAS